MNAIDVFKSLSEPIRLRLLHLLAHAEEELCVCDLVTIIGAPQGTISRHLTHLRLLNWVTDRRSGTWIYYKLTAPEDKLRLCLFNCLKTCFESDPILAQDLKTYADLKKKNRIASCQV